MLVKGWFSDTLTQHTIERLGIERAGIILVDCDLYSSARQALKFCVPLIRGQAVVIFDDWNSGGLAERDMGEKRAFDEFLCEHPRFGAQELATYSCHGRPNGKVFRVFEKKRASGQFLNPDPERL